MVQQNLNGSTTTTSVYVLGVAEQRTFVIIGQSPTSTAYVYQPIVAASNPGLQRRSDLRAASV